MAPRSRCSATCTPSVASPAAENHYLIAAWRGYRAAMPQRTAWRVALSPPAPDAVGRLLGLLPGWFGPAASNAADSVPFLQVKTQGPGYPDAGYEKTRQFYAGIGFQPLEEIHGLWPGLPCLIMIKYLGQGQPGAGAPR
jgi:hypothetical protein